MSRVKLGCEWLRLVSTRLWREAGRGRIGEGKAGRGKKGEEC